MLPSMGTSNFKNRTMWTGDNLDIMRGMNSSSIDLIYLDPPFNSNRNYAAPIGSKAAGAAFKDTWTLSDVDVAWHGEIAEQSKAVYSVIDTAGEVHGKGMKSYLIMMAIRLLEMHRILKDTGSIYLHCDPTAGHYLKLLMDAIFEKDQFKNEIIWHYRRWTGKSKRFQRLHDVVLFYCRSKNYVFNQLYTDYTTGSKERKEQGVLHRFKDGMEPHLVSIGEIDKKGVPENDVWHIPFIAPSAKERIGYPTQKPLALLDRIIKASSNEGDMILDPFAGCATACVAAERLKRQWVGIDISAKAVELVRFRIRQLDLFHDFTPTERTDIPLRTDLGKLPHYRTHKHQLYGKQEGHCVGCKTLFDFRNLSVDHIVPKSKGGTDHYENLQLLCGACNSLKGTRTQAEFLAQLQSQRRPRRETDYDR